MRTPLIGQEREVAEAWVRSYPSGHRARITKSFDATFSLEVFTTSGDRVLDVALLMPSLELAKETADYIVNSQGEPSVSVSREGSPPALERLLEHHETAQPPAMKSGSHTKKR